MIITNDFELLAALYTVEGIWELTDPDTQAMLDDLVDAIEKYESERLRF